VALVGLRTWAGLRQSTPRSAASYQPGERVGIFTLLANTEDEVLLVDRDRHLDVYIALSCRSAADGQCW
jgi:hypothetical protein